MQVGDAVPSVTLYGATPGDEVNLAEYVGTKTVVMFGVPGAFTPGCSKVFFHSSFVSLLADFQIVGRAQSCRCLWTAFSGTLARMDRQDSVVMSVLTIQLAGHIISLHLFATPHPCWWCH
jgi:peroxiredoxin